MAEEIWGWNNRGRDGQSGDGTGHCTTYSVGASDTVATLRVEQLT